MPNASDADGNWKTTCVGCPTTALNERVKKQLLTG